MGQMREGGRERVCKGGGERERQGGWAGRKVCKGERGRWVGERERGTSADRCRARKGRENRTPAHERTPKLEDKWKTEARASKTVSAMTSGIEKSFICWVQK